MDDEHPVLFRAPLNLHRCSPCIVICLGCIPASIYNGHVGEPEARTTLDLLCFSKTTFSPHTLSVAISTSFHVPELEYNHTSC
jgi:hypothetical protein